MNARQKIKKLKSENRFLREIIKDHAEMERVYHLWMDGLKVNVTTRRPEMLRAFRSYPSDTLKDPKYLAYAKKSMAREMSEGLIEFAAWKVTPHPEPHKSYLEAKVQIIKTENE